MSSAALQRDVQQKLFETHSAGIGRQGTFFPNYRTAVHRWYPYIEGFSSDLVQNLIDEFAEPESRIYDPFAGTGTTVTVSAANRLLSFYSEINPFMRLVIECKTNSLRKVARNKRVLEGYFEQISSDAARLISPRNATKELRSAFGNRPFFRGRRLSEIVALRSAILVTDSPTIDCRLLARLGLASIAVACSEMKRAADLRYRTTDEALPDDCSPFDAFRDKTREILDDIEPSLADLPPVVCLSESALTSPQDPAWIDLVITSPPYVNGTNYFRNTKLELWLTGILERESDLPAYTDVALAAGINNVSRRGRTPVEISSVERIARQLDETAYDRRIPELIRRYFSDTQTWVRNVARLLRPGGRAIIDIGDSRFAGVHVPTDELVTEIAQFAGLQLDEVRSVRKRTSKDGSALKQVLLVLRRPHDPKGRPAVRHRDNGRQEDRFRSAAVEFEHSLPHRQSPFASRNWGHGLHSLCSYQGKLKPAIAHLLVQRFSDPGDTVLDPLSGCGTIPLESFLQGRTAIGNDLQELGFLLTRAKISRGSPEEPIRVLDDLLQFVDKRRDSMNPESYSDFGLNGRIPDYFHPTTYQEVLAARQYIAQFPCDSWARAVVYSSAVHILHGNRPYALSRRSHPVTPLKPSGPNTYRPLAPRLRAKMLRVLSHPVPCDVMSGEATLGSYEFLNPPSCVDVVITSPPFAASTRFFSTNWMRLWMTGWEPADFVQRRSDFLENQQARSMDVYRRFFACAARWLRPGGRLILHVGRTASTDMAAELECRASADFQLIHSFDEDVAGREKFGLRDQGATTSHQYLFFRRVD